MDTSKRFIVTCHGWSGSRWLGFILEQHQEITCSHSAKNLHAIHCDFNHLDLNQQIQEFHKGYKNRQEMPIEENYNDILSYGDTPFYGSVHLYRLRDLPVLYETFGEFEHHYTVMNLIRHPVTLVWSGYGEFQSLIRFDINDLYWTLDKILKAGKEFVFDLAKKHQLYLGDNEILSFIGACAVLGSLSKDVAAEKMIDNVPSLTFKGHVKMEEVTSAPEVLRELLNNVTNNEIKIDQGYLDTVYNTRPLNKHRSDNKILTPQERYTSLTDWQKEVFLYFFNHHKLEPFYSSIGYDFSFLKS